MPKVDINKTELVWPGKYNTDGSPKDVPRVNLPFQIIETINEKSVCARGSEEWRSSNPVRYLYRRRGGRIR